MRKIVTIAALAAAVAGATVPAAVASGTPNARSQAQKQCRQERSTVGSATFKLTYGTNKNRSNAFGKCVSHRTSQNQTAQAQAQQNASQQCRAEQSQDATAFSQKYGTAPQYRDAFGKCVSGKAKAQSAQTEQNEVQAEENAAQQCRSERSSIGKDAFAQKYGTNRNKRNAFGKCVSQKAKAQEQQQQSS